MNLLVKTLLLLCIWDYRRHTRNERFRHSQDERTRNIIEF
jgi:hypothetical protein